MLRSTCLLVLGLTAGAFAHESSYTGPMFNPSEAPYFAQTGLVIPTQTDLPAIQPTNAFSMATTISGIILPSTLSRSAATASTSSSASSGPSSSSASSSASRSASSTVSSGPTAASSSAPAEQSTGAAVVNRAGVLGTVAGGLLAGLVLV